MKLTYKEMELRLSDALQQLDVQTARSEALVVENAGLKECAVNYVHAVALWSSWADAEDKISPVPETPATDAFLAEVRAQGVEMFAAHLRTNSNEQSPAKLLALGAEEFAAQLRGNSNGGAV